MSRTDEDHGGRRRGRGTRCAVAAAAALVCLGCWAASAQAYVYWTDAQNGTIGRANLDGSDLEQSFVTSAGEPRALAVDAGHVYWGNRENEGIGRADLEGEKVEKEFVSTGANADPEGVAVDAGHVYWTDWGSDNAIGRADIDGSDPEPEFIIGADESAGVAVDAGHIYWANQGAGTIGRADLDGTNVDQSFINGLHEPYGLAVDAGHVYWTDSANGTIGRADLDGSDPEPGFITGAEEPRGLAVDAGHVYWVNYAPGTIGRADLGGTNVDQSFITGAEDPEGLAVDPGNSPGAPAPGPSSAPTPPPAPAPTSASAPAPVVTITKGPAHETSASAAVFDFAGTLGGRYECSLDGGPWKPCSSGRDFGPARPGDHLFQVREKLGGAVSAIASYRWTVDLPKACVLRVARARVFAYARHDKARLVIHYTTYRPAEVTVTYALKGRKGGLKLGSAAAEFQKAGVFRLPVGLSKAETGKVRAAKSFRVRFQIARTPKSCGRYYTKRLTIPRKISGQTVWFQSDSGFTAAGGGR